MNYERLGIDQFEFSCPVTRNQKNPDVRPIPRRYLHEGLHTKRLRTIQALLDLNREIRAIYVSVKHD